MGSVIRSVNLKVPAQVLCQLFAIKEGLSDDSLAVFRNVCKFLEKVRELKPLMKHELPKGDPSRASLNLRLGLKGKFVNRNRNSRKPIFLCL